MEETLFKLVGDSIFAAVAVWMIITSRKDSKEREDKLIAHNEGYQKVLADLGTGQLQLASAVTEMRGDIDELKDDVADLKRR